jgi:hypothetical protein
MKPDFWRFLHDGEVTQLRGQVPGTVWMFVEIQYLRAEFPGEGVGFEVALDGCTQFEYQEWDAEPIASLVRILEKRPSFVHVESLQPLELTCVTGMLRLRYSNATVATDSGWQLRYEDLEAGSEAYWEEWRKRNHIK